MTAYNQYKNLQDKTVEFSQTQHDMSAPLLDSHGNPIASEGGTQVDRDTFMFGKEKAAIKPENKQAGSFEVSKARKA